MKKRKTAIGFNKPWEAYVFLTPWILGLLCFTIIPMAMSLYFSFTQYDMLTPPRWVGLRNFTDMLEDQRLHKSLQVTSTFVFIGVPIQLTFALFIAGALKNSRFGIRFYRAVYYLPSLFGGSVAVSLLWRQIFNRDGVFNHFLALFGIEGINWIGTPGTVLYTLILLQVWQFGSSMVIFLGGLKGISQDYYEAAAIDGAGRVGSFRFITLPLLTPMIFFNLVMGVIGAFQSFTSAFIVSGGSGGPLDALLFYTLYLFIRAFRNFSMGYSSAMAWVLLVIIAIVTRLLFISSNKWVYYEDKR